MGRLGMGIQRALYRCVFSLCLRVLTFTYQQQQPSHGVRLWSFGANQPE